VSCIISNNPLDVSRDLILKRVIYALMRFKIETKLDEVGLGPAAQAIPNLLGSS
jgi:hypothetical protein